MLTIVSRMKQPETIGERIKRLREGRRWSQRQLAERADLGSGYVSLVERGGRHPKPDTLLKLAAAFRITLEELSDGVAHTIQEGPAGYETGNERQARVRAHLLAIEEMDEEEFDQLADFIEKRRDKIERDRRGK